MIIANISSKKPQLLCSYNRSIPSSSSIFFLLYHRTLFHEAWVVSQIVWMSWKCVDWFLSARNSYCFRVSWSKSGVYNGVFTVSARNASCRIMWAILSFSLYLSISLLLWLFEYMLGHKTVNECRFISCGQFVFFFTVVYNSNHIYNCVYVCSLRYS